MSRMKLRTLTLMVLLVAALTIDARPAAAKGGEQGWLVTGGELGEFVAYFEGPERPLRFAPYGGIFDDVRGEPPSDPSVLSYDFFDSVQIAYQLLLGGPELTYYPDLGLVRFHQRLDSGGRAGWYQPSAAQIAFMDGAITTALADRDAGRLGRDLIAADFRGRGLDRVAYALVPYPQQLPLPDGWPARLASPAGITVIEGAASEQLIMRHLIETLSRPAHLPTRERPAYHIAFIDGPVDPSGIGVGFYTPPVDGQPGRFWYSPGANVRYWETTPGFDAAIAPALGDAWPSSSVAARSHALTVALLAAVLGLAGTAVALRGMGTSDRSVVY